MVKERFFYTIDTPHEWSSGKRIVNWNDTYQPIASLEEARELAATHTKGRDGQAGYVRTTYGIEYTEE